MITRKLIVGPRYWEKKGILTSYTLNRCYGDFLAFFDKQVELLGSETVLERYFYTSVLQQSIGSQLQPLVHLAFGIEHGLSLVVTQALAYLACTFLDASDLTCTADPLASTTGNQDVHVLFDMVAADQRFDGRFDGGNTLYSAVKVLLKSKSELLRTYMTEWTAIAKNDVSQQHGLFLLAELAAKLIRQSSSKSAGQIELDEFLGGGQLLASALAIHTIIAHCPRHIELDVNSLVNLQFLSMLCTYVVQGRPKSCFAASSTHVASPPVDWSDCASAIIESGDPKAVLALRSLKQAWQCDKNDIYRDTATFLMDFVHDGVWVKGGIGWKAVN